MHYPNKIIVLIIFTSFLQLSSVYAKFTFQTTVRRPHAMERKKGDRNSKRFQPF